MKSIVFVQTAFIGDLFLSLPTLNRIRSLYPSYRLVLVCKKGLSDYFVKNKIVDQAYEVEKGDRQSYKSALDQINHLSVEYVFCVHKSLRSALFVRQIKANYKIGFSRFLSTLFFSDTVDYIKKYPDVIRQLNILSTVDQALSYEITKKDWTYLNFFDDQKNKFSEIPDPFQFNYKNKSNKSRKVGIFPGSVWATKKWTVSGFSDVVRFLIENKYEVFLMGAPAEKNICDQIHARNPDCLNLAGQLKLAESIQKISDFDFIVCNDSAPAHMAASQGIPSVVIFGPTTLDLGFRPWHDLSVVVENKKIDCRPCGAHGPMVCPLKHHNCMNSITAQDVISHLQYLLN